MKLHSSLFTTLVILLSHTKCNTVSPKSAAIVTEPLLSVSRLWAPLSLFEKAYQVWPTAKVCILAQCTELSEYLMI